MKQLTHRFWAKTVAAALFAAAVLGMLYCIMSAVAGVAYTRGEMAGAEYWIQSIGYTGNFGMVWFVSGAIFCIVLAIMLFVFLLTAAGRRRDSAEPVRSRLDKLPLDLLLVVAILAYTLLFVGLRAAGDLYYTALMLLPVGLLLLAGILFTLMLCMTFAARIKTGTLWRNNILAYILVFLWRMLIALMKNLQLLWKVILVYVVFGIACMGLFSESMHDGGAVLLFLLLTGAMLFALCLAAMQMQRLQAGAKALAAGDLTHRIDTKGLHFDIKTHAEALNGIGTGMQRAVEERMKSERMKTDLIANVSHDLKTPLTSIVNYIDLLQKEELQNDTAKEYVEVLARQAQRLKKLTVDIVDASKASSGVLNVTLCPTDVREILHQSLAEYAEKFALAQITPVVQMEEYLPPILADGRLSWRVLDNLLNNACKYALPGTRLYCEAMMRDGKVMLMLKNISREQLGMPAEELMERFVRGDAARASEGSGLGLSIAKSLMELQKGELRMEADGDLFKAILVFARAEQAT